MREIAWVRDLYRCVICGEKVDDGHHRVPKGMGGSKDEDRHRPDRVVSACRKHHVPSIHRCPALAADLGYFVLNGENAWEKPIWYPKEGSWFLLLPGGTRIYEQMPTPKIMLT